MTCLCAVVGSLRSFSLSLSIAGNKEYVFSVARNNDIVRLQRGNVGSDSAKDGPSGCRQVCLQCLLLAFLPPFINK